MQDLQDVVDKIPPEAWPLIDSLFRWTLIVVAIWLVISILAWWRRRAYNLTVAATARRSRKAQPDFLKVDEKARDAAIRRGEAHEAVLEDRERDEALAALKASKDPLSFGQRIAGIAAAGMSVFTLLTIILGAVTNVSKMGEALQTLSSVEKVKAIVSQHLAGTIIVLLVIAWHIYKYVADRQWKEE